MLQWLIKFVNTILFTTICYYNLLLQFVKKICYYNLLIQFLSTFLFFLVRSDVKIVRSCGHEKYTNLAGEEKDEYTTVLEEYNTFVTTCFDDK